MPAFKAQTRFLLRGSALLIGLLTLWWLVLLGPMLSMLKGAAGGFVLIRETATGDWTLRVPLERILPATPERPAPRQIRSIEFDLARSDLVGFTFSLPVFWAVILAAPGIRRSLRPLLLGTAVMCAVELLLLLAFAQIGARNAAAQYAGSEDAFDKWMLQVGEYLVVNALPYAVPFVVALSLHPELRGAVFPSIKAAKTSEPAVSGGPREPRRRKK
jgi:hypothetical protein